MVARNMNRDMLVDQSSIIEEFNAHDKNTKSQLNLKRNEDQWRRTIKYLKYKAQKSKSLLEGKTRFKKKKEVLGLEQSFRVQMRNANMFYAPTQSRNQYASVWMTYIGENYARKRPKSSISLTQREVNKTKIRDQL